MSTVFVRLFLRTDVNRFKFGKFLINPLILKSCSQSRDRHFCTEIPAQDDYSVTIKYIKGLPHITVPLPSRNENCRFALKPVSHNVGDFIEMLRLEDRGIDRATVLNNDGIRVASTCSIESLLDEPFCLHINDQTFKVIPPERERLDVEDNLKLGNVRSLVSQLYEALNVGEHHIKKEKELLEKLEELKYKISPLEEKRHELSLQASRRTNMKTWLGLGLMSVQFGILARLTWWEYSWDIMEPVTYFVTYGTAMAVYAYFCITKQEYNYQEAQDRQYLITIHKRAKKKGFDIDTYNDMKRQIAELEYDLRRLKDPLHIQLPPHIKYAVPPPILPQESESSPSTDSSTKSKTKEDSKSNN